jgi:hypothetical protein
MKQTAFCTDRSFPQVPETAGEVMLEVAAPRVHVWNGEEEEDQAARRVD